MGGGDEESRPSSRQRIGKKKLSAANEMALKIGLQIAPKGSTTKGASTSRSKKKKSRPAPPVIQWSSDMEEFFWPTTTSTGEGNPNAKAHSEGNPSTSNMRVHRIANKQSFPLVLLQGVLSAESVDEALSLCENGVVAEEMEQHELVCGNVRTLRRSLVSRLDAKGELLQEILSHLPAELVAGYHMGGQGREGSYHPAHPYEDGSVVYYRTAKGDFYDEHHDSFSPGDAPRERQRAYTVLLYLRAPPGPPSIGGTEFTRLTLTDGSLTCVDTSNSGTGLLVKPSAGDALVWPNFDRNGRPYQDSLHRALPVAAPSRGHKGVKLPVVQADSVEQDRIGKVVVNLWFEGSGREQNE
jgi:hypothetical protein